MLHSPGLSSSQGPGDIRGACSTIWVQMAERGDATALEWHQKVSTSLSKFIAQQFNSPVGAPCQPLASTPLLKGCTLNIFMLSKIAFFKNNFIYLVPCEVIPGMFSLW